jgi:hypothetical protein
MYDRNWASKINKALSLKLLMKTKFSANCQRGSVAIQISRHIASLIGGLFLVSTPGALADAQLEILVGSTEVYDSGDLASASGYYGTPYSYSSSTTSFSLYYGWNSEIRGSNGHLLSLGIYINSTVPVIFELSDNNNIVAHGSMWTQVAADGGEEFVGSAVTYLSANNALLAPTDQLFGLPIPKYFGVSGVFLDASGPYSLTDVVKVDGVGNKFMTVNTYIPDGGMTLSMVGVSFFGLLAVRYCFTCGKRQSA